MVRKQHGDRLKSNHINNYSYICIYDLNSAVEGYHQNRLEVDVVTL